MYGSLIPLVIILKPCKDLIPELCTKWFEELSGPLCFAFNNAKNRWLSHRQGMWSQLCGMNIWSDGWQSRLTSFENTGTTSSTSSKVQVLRVIALTLPPTWVILYTTAHFPFTAPYSNSQYNMSSMLLSLVNRSIFSSSHRSLIILIVPAIIYIDKWGRRPMLLVGTLLMGLWMFLVGGIQGAFGKWSDASGTNVWVIMGNMAATRAVIVCSYLFVCR